MSENTPEGHHPDPPAPATSAASLQPPPPPTGQLEQWGGRDTGVLLQIGDIGITEEFVLTPNGNGPMSGASWVVSDQSRTEQKMPTYAVVLAVLLFLACFLGLLFLLIKEEKTTGYVEVRVQSGNLMHMTQIPVSSPLQVAQIRAAVGQAQTMSRR